MIALQYSNYCNQCPGLSRCKNVPTSHEPMELKCPICYGVGCDECDDGYIIINGCPLEFIGDEVNEYYRLVNFYEKGLPPVSGGVLDQANKFIEIAEFVFNQKEIAKAEMIKAVK